MGGIYKQWAYRGFTRACHYAMALWGVVHFGSNAAVEINGSSLFYSSHSSPQGSFAQVCLQGLNERGELQAKLSSDCELRLGLFCVRHLNSGVAEGLLWGLYLLAVLMLRLQSAGVWKE